MAGRAVVEYERQFMAKVHAAWHGVGATSKPAEGREEDTANPAALDEAVSGAPALAGTDTEAGAGPRGTVAEDSVNTVGSVEEASTGPVAEAGAGPPGAFTEDSANTES